MTARRAKTWQPKRKSRQRAIVIPEVRPYSPPALPDEFVKGFLDVWEPIRQIIQDMAAALVPVVQNLVKVIQEVVRGLTRTDDVDLEKFRRWAAADSVDWTEEESEIFSYTE